MKKLLLIFITTVVLFIPITTNAYARSVVLMDLDSGRVLYEKNKDEKRLVASISKIMTAVLALENGNLDDVVEIGDDVLKMYGSNIYISPGDKLTLRDLLYGLILRSGNDAAISIALHIGTTEANFVEMMNKKAKELGMMSTIYENPHGLDEETKNYTTAYDMAKLSRYAYKIEEYRKISSTKKWIVQANNKTDIWYNRNKLLFRYKYATGGKTGYTPKAGRTLVSTASKDNLNLTIVSLDDYDHYKNHEELYEYAFNKYKKYLIIDKNNFNIDSNFYKDKVYVKNSFSYPLTEEETKNIRVIAKIYKLDKYKNNDKVGEVKVLLKDKEIYKDDIYVKVNKKQSLIEKIKNIFK